MKMLLILSLLAGMIYLAGCQGKEEAPSRFPESKLAIFKSSSCGCCGIFSQYMGREGFDVSVTNNEQMEQLKAEHGVPPELQSCHTTIVGDYFVEGHIPAEAFDKLLTEKPDIKGIAMPGMPSGSPGMPGSKQGPWIIYAVHNDGSTSEFMRI